MKKICIYNNKGGVAKTTSVINVAYALHKAGKKVLVVDCDMQQNSYNFFLKNKAGYFKRGVVLCVADERSENLWQQ